MSTCAIDEIVAASQRIASHETKWDASDVLDFSDHKTQLAAARQTTGIMYFAFRRRNLWYLLSPV
jgi:hypothetical protein